MANKVHLTGASGFIGSNLVRFLNSKGIVPIIYDNFTGGSTRWKYLVGLDFVLGKMEDLKFKNEDDFNQDILIHLAANVDTKETMNDDLLYNNYYLPLKIFSKFKRVVYASSGAAYGNEQNDFSERIVGLKPTNAYGFTKWALDLAAVQNPTLGGIQVFGLRFFNVYGPNETHKGDMQSVVSKAAHKLAPLYQDGAYHLFKSDREGIPDGGQLRDFVYVEDVCKVIHFFVTREAPYYERGVFNVGSGKARSFVDLVKAVDPEASIQYVDMPEVLKSSYQYFTQADLTNLRKAGYAEEFTSLEDGVRKTIALTFPKHQG